MRHQLLGVRGKEIDVSLRLLSLSNLVFNNLLLLFEFALFLLAEITFHLSVDKTKYFVIVNFLLVQLPHYLLEVQVTRHYLLIFV